MDGKFRQGWKPILKNCGHSMRWNGRMANLTSLVTTRRRASTCSTTVQRKAPKAAAVCVTTGKRWRQERTQAEEQRDGYGGRHGD
jgi:hypothetical protein